MTIEQRAYFACRDELHYLCGWANGSRVRLEASPSVELTPKEACQLASYLVHAAHRAEERLGKLMPS